MSNVCGPEDNVGQRKRDKIALEGVNKCEQHKVKRCAEMSRQSSAGILGMHTGYKSFNEEFERDNAQKVLWRCAIGKYS